MTYLISPTEPIEIKAIGTVSSVPENYGVDILWPSKLGLVGVQRKEVKDFVNSVQDGRLGKELSQMKQLTLSALVLEGTMHWTAEGQCLNIGTWSQNQHLGTLFTIQSQGCWLLTSMNVQGTISSVSWLKKWIEKDSHTNLLSRPNPVSRWGRADNRDWGIHLLQSFPNIGYKMAGQIYDHFGGVPLQWLTDEFGLAEVSGIGPVRAANLMKVLEQHGEQTDRLREEECNPFNL